MTKCGAKTLAAMDGCQESITVVPCFVPCFTGRSWTTMEAVQLCIGTTVEAVMYITKRALSGLTACPHCSAAKPGTSPLGDRRLIDHAPTGHSGLAQAAQMYICNTCLGVVTAVSHLMSTGDAANAEQVSVLAVYPVLVDVSGSVPERPRQYLRDAQGALNAPSASIMASCSAIDAMLSEKGVPRSDGSLAKRINLAVDQGILTKGMSEWAHRVRLDANDQRHADETAPLPDQDQAKRTLRLAKAMAELLFVLPAEAERDGNSTPPKGGGATGSK